MTYQTTERQQLKHEKDFKKVAQAHGSVIMTLTVKLMETNIDINDKKAVAEFVKLMKLSVKETQTHY